jgi:hypothetical protein
MAQKAKSFRPLADRMTAFGQLANALHQGLPFACVALQHNKRQQGEITKCRGKGDTPVGRRC